MSKAQELNDQILKSLQHEKEQYIELDPEMLLKDDFINSLIRTVGNCAHLGCQMNRLVEITGMFELIDERTPEALERKGLRNKDEVLANLTRLINALCLRVMEITNRGNSYKGN